MTGERRSDCLTSTARANLVLVSSRAVFPDLLQNQRTSSLHQVAHVGVAHRTAGEIASFDGPQKARRNSSMFEP